MVRLRTALAATSLLCLLSACDSAQTTDTEPPATTQRTDALSGGLGVSNGLIPLGAVAPKPGLDWDGDGVAEFSVFRPGTGEWFVTKVADTEPPAVGGDPVPQQLGNEADAEARVLLAVLGAAGDYPVPADYNGDGRLEAAYFRVRNGTWGFQDGSTAIVGANGDIPVPGDYDGNGAAEPSTYRPVDGTWHFLRAGVATSVTFGTRGDIPVPADYDGDGRTDVAVWTPTTGAWARYDVSTGERVELGVLGIPGDRPVAGDYDGDGLPELAVFRSTTAEWLIAGRSTEQFGLPGDWPVAADYDGDGRVDVAIYRPTDSTFWLSTRPTPVRIGQPADEPAHVAFQGMLTCDRPYGCTMKSQASWQVLETVLWAHYTGAVAAPGYVFRPWILVGECEAGTPWFDTEIEMGLYPRGFRSPDRGPYQISPIHFFHGTRDEWTAARSAWTKQEDPIDNDVALETDTDVYGWGFRWGDMMDPARGSQFAVMLAAHQQVRGIGNLGPWFRSKYCHAYEQTLVPIASDISFPVNGDYVRFVVQGNRYVRVH